MLNKKFLECASLEKIYHDICSNHSVNYELLFCSSIFSQKNDSFKAWHYQKKNAWDSETMTILSYLDIKNKLTNF